MTLHVHRAPRADRLADGLARMLARPPADPFAADVVAVPTRGMERWLTQHMSAVLGASHDRRDGVCANVLFPTPHRLTTDATARACEIDPLSDPWLPERATWPLLAVVEQSLPEPWLAALASYLGADDGDATYKRSRRLSFVAHLARLFDRYAMHRPAMIAAWREGADVDGAGEPLRADAIWQPELWRRLRARIVTADPAQRREQAHERLIAEPHVAELPERIALFGLTRLPTGQLQVLRALAVHRDVHLFLLHPSPRLWQQIADTTELPPRSRSRGKDPTAHIAANRLLASWGRDAREMQLVLGAGNERADHDEGADTPPATLLGRLQRDIRDDRRAPGAPLADAKDERMPLAAHDRSLEVHACHGRVRQVEVLRDAILHALADDEMLEPRDVIVMCPDIETFAPLIGAAFGAGEPPLEDGERAEPEGERAPGARELRVRLADRALHQTNPVLGTVAALLELVGERVTASQVLDLADRGPVRRRFRFDDEDLARIQDWVRDAGIRWGLDATHRRPYGLHSVQTGTWEAGLDRVLVGVTMAEDTRSFRRVLPLDDVDSRAIDLSGRLSELVQRLTTALDALGRTQTLAEWADALADAADALTATADRDRWQRAELQRLLDELQAEADGAPGADAIMLAPAEIASHLGERLQGRPTRANFRTGHLTVCTLEPMRSVPHRIVCLLGLDDDAFPRKAPRDGDDLLLDDPCIGERDPRSEDRQLLLDALMAAGERLIVTYTGHDERTNTRRAPAVPIGELLDTIDATARCDDDPVLPASARVCIAHPLQPFDPRNFAADALGRPQPWSFDADALAGAEALGLPRAERAPFLPAPLPPRVGELVELRDLVSFVEHPVRAFLRQRLGVRLGAFEDDVSDALSIELTHLERWAVGRRLLEARLRGASRREACLAEIDRGLLPPGQLGRRIIEEVEPLVDAIAESARGYAEPGASRDPLDIRVRLQDGRLVTGTVPAAHGDVMLNAIYSRVGPKQRIASWVALVAASATHPDRALRAVTVGRGRRDEVCTAEAAIVAGSTAERGGLARAELERLVALYDVGMREPLPLFCRTSAAYVEAARVGLDAAAEAEREWKSDFMSRGGWFSREDEEPEHLLVLGGKATFAELLGFAPGAAEEGDGWASDEPSRLGRLARRLWDGLLDHEQVSTR
ncbi:MAG TPA: exodeoxyribonuclease V subunit gamma [Solirubrobacteraceae bacterium]|nr:exodeoxyribonuclease V subunit gamma [Solirubrobacteraceae bacterium]